MDDGCPQIRADDYDSLDDLQEDAMSILSSEGEVEIVGNPVYGARAAGYSTALRYEGGLMEGLYQLQKDPKNFCKRVLNGDRATGEPSCIETSDGIYLEDENV